MPMKFSKAFPRRKSSGNALEDIQNPPESTFRVIPRNEVNKVSNDTASRVTRISGSRPFSSPLQKGRQQSFEDDSGASHRGSNGSSGANSTFSRQYDSYSSSARFSSSSTLPSSTDPEPSDDLFSKKGHSHKPWSPEGHTFSLRGAARTFTFGNRGHRNSMSSRRNNTAEEENMFESESSSRDRSLTASSYASTAVPPKLDADLSLGSSNFGGGFGDLFSGIGRPKSAIMEEAEPTQSPVTITKSGSEPALSKPTSLATRPGNTPAPIRVDQSREIESSPYSWDSRDSHDGLMSSPRLKDSPVEERAPPVPRHGLNPISSHIATPEPAAAVTERKSGRFGTPRIPGQKRRDSWTASGEVEDEDAQLVMNSVRASRNLGKQDPVRASPSGLVGKLQEEENALHRKPLSGSSSDASVHTPSMSSAGSSLRAPDSQNTYQSIQQTTPTASLVNDHATPNDVTPRAKQTEPRVDDEPLFDPATVASASAALKYTESVPQNQQPVKVMTKSEFEKYREQQENRDDASESESEASDEYYDEDETERNRQLAKQRDKQSQQLAVFRQKMRKTTGEPAPEHDTSQFRPSFMASYSTPNLTLGVTSVGMDEQKVGGGGKNSDDEDEDVPLGILQAHGFPNKNRPPTRLTNSNSSINLIRPPSQTGLTPPRPGSAAGSVSGAPKGTLPPFARNLPADPYFGASLVNPSNRESLTYGRTGTGSVYGGNSSSAPVLPPGGLVGVIAGEERARAMRRGSPNTQGGYGPLVQQPLGNQQMFGMPQMPAMGQMNPYGMPMMGGFNMGMQAPPGPSADQVQLNQQMSALMTMNMQLMQQQMMMLNPGMAQQSNMQQNGGQQMMPGQANGFLAPPSGPMARPMSMASNGSGMPQQQRTMSMVNPPQWNPPSMGGYAPSVQGLSLHPNGYAPSLAPSERSNVGMASRYRPVSHLPADATSTVTSSATVQPATQTPEAKKKGGVFARVRAVEKPKSARSEANGNADDDDDEGWGDLKAKKNRWKEHKSSNSAPALKDLYFDNA